MATKAVEAAQRSSRPILTAVPTPTFEERRDFNPTDELTARNWLEQRIARGQQEVFSEVVKVWPALATLLLEERNAANRPLRTSKLRQYVRAGTEDRWELNGECVIISKDGFLSDGQHRMEMVRMANRPIDMVFMFGIHRDTRRTIDTGSTRRAQDYLAIEGVSNPGTCASAARLILGMQRGGGSAFLDLNAISNPEIIDKVMGDEQIRISARFIDSLKRDSMRGIIAPAIAATAHYLMAKKDAPHANNFIGSICNGGCTHGTVRYMTRDRLATVGNSSRNVRMEILLRGWNAERGGDRNPSLPILGEFPKAV